MADTNTGTTSGAQAAPAGPAANADQVVLITGCASGIGRGTALAFAALNYRLVLVDKQAERLAETGQLCCEKSSKKYKPIELAVDISEDEQVAKSVIGKTLAEFGQLDVLVNNAGITALTKFDDDNCVSVYHKIIATNMHAVVYLCLAAHDALKATRGSIVNVSSVLDNQPAKHKFAYCMSKAAITMLTKCLANDFAPSVRVNCVSPGPIASSILDDMGINLDERRTNAQKSTLVARIGEPEEVAKMIIYLSSKEKAAFITGSRVLVDGGYTVLPNISGIKLRGASFLMHQVYDDEMTFKLVAAASTVSGLPVEVCLEEFGKHFLVYCQKNGYDQILRVLGSNLYDFLTNLDNLHDHLASIYPGMRAPSFRVTRHINTNHGLHPDQVAIAHEKSPGDELHKQNASCSLAGSMYLHYYSERAGLSPIVKGLVMAVAREFFQTNIQVTECPLMTELLIKNNEGSATDDHVVLKIDRESGLSQQRSAADHEEHVARSQLSAPLDDQQQHDAAISAARPESQSGQLTKSSMLNSYDSLSTDARDSLVNSEIMMQTFPFHVIFDRQFNLVQIGRSLLRVTSLFWQRWTSAADDQQADNKKQSVRFTDLFAIVRPKIDFTFDAIADHTNQVFVVRTRPLVLNADYLNLKRHSSSGSSSGSSAATGSTVIPPPSRPLVCPMDRLAAAHRERRQHAAAELSAADSLGSQEELVAELAAQPASAPDVQAVSNCRSAPQLQHQTGTTDNELGDLPINSLSLRLKGQMIILLGGQLCLFLCSPRVDHLNQLDECGVRMSDFALHDRARELMLMSHTHKEDREAVKKLDQASNDLKKMDTKLRQENKRTEEVLHNIFPAKIATLLSHGHKVESESFDLVTCLYSDIIGFTKMCGSENVRPIDIVRLLNTLYLQFDNLTTIHGVFKVETIGDAYVVVGGLPEPVEDHADRCVRMGLDMVKVIGTVRSPADRQPIQMRIGIHSGPVMAGIVGIRVPRYSLFGNTTTLANQLEANGVGGKIHISDFTLKQLINRSKFVVEDNPASETSGFPFVTYFVTNYLGDQDETLAHAKLLEEQLIKDFELMGNEVELVDESGYACQLYGHRPTVAANCAALAEPSLDPGAASGSQGAEEKSSADRASCGKRPALLAAAAARSDEEDSARCERLILMDIEDRRALDTWSHELSSAILDTALEQVAEDSQRNQLWTVLTDVCNSQQIELVVRSRVKQVDTDSGGKCPLCDGCGSLDNQAKLGQHQNVIRVKLEAKPGNSIATPNDVRESLNRLAEWIQAQKAAVDPNGRACRAARTALPEKEVSCPKTNHEAARRPVRGQVIGPVLSSEVQRIKRMDTLKCQKLKRKQQQQQQREHSSFELETDADEDDRHRRSICVDRDPIEEASDEFDDSQAPPVASRRANGSFSQVEFAQCSVVPAPAPVQVDPKEQPQVRQQQQEQQHRPQPASHYQSVRSSLASLVSEVQAQGRKRGFSLKSFANLSFASPFSSPTRAARPSSNPSVRPPPVAGKSSTTMPGDRKESTRSQSSGSQSGTTNCSCLKTSASNQSIETSNEGGKQRAGGKR